jgi:hypothetical protein
VMAELITRGTTTTPIAQYGISRFPTVQTNAMAAGCME